MPRRPKPRTTPVTLAELILDLEDRMQGEEGDDVLSDVWLEGVEWIALVHRAEEERDTFGAGPINAVPGKDLEAMRFAAETNAAGWKQAKAERDEALRNLAEAIDRLQQLTKERNMTCADCGGVVSGDASGAEICSCPAPIGWQLANATQVRGRK